MNIYPLSVLISDTSLWVKSLGVLAIGLCILFTIWLYRHQKGSNLTKAKSEPANKAKNIPKRRNSS